MKMTPMQCVAAFVAAVSTCVSPAAALSNSGQFFLSSEMRPEVAAKTLARVQDEWIVEAAAFADCQAKSGALGNCGGSQQSFGASCSKVVDAIVRGSSGDQNKVAEYMNSVCAQHSLSSVHHTHCLGLQHAIDGALQFNSYENRMRYNSGALCSKFWSTFAESEHKRAEAEQKQAEVERAKEKEMLIKANELAQKRRVEDDAKKQKEEVKQKLLIAQRKAMEAKDQAAKARKEAVERLARKKAAAQAAQKEAEEKVTKAALEAAKAAEEHRQRELEHAKAEENLRKITMAHQKANMANASTQSVAKANPLPTNATKSSDQKEDVKGTVVTLKEREDKKDDKKNGDKKPTKL